MEDITIRKLNKEARHVANQMGIKDKNISMMGLDPTDPLQYLRGRGKGRRRPVPDEIKIAAGRLRKKYNLE